MLLVPVCDQCAYQPAEVAAGDGQVIDEDYAGMCPGFGSPGHEYGWNRFGVVCNEGETVLRSGAEDEDVICSYERGVAPLVYAHYGNLGPL